MARIVSWNINGVRSLRQSLPQTIASLNADICCFQETKITRGALDTDIAFVDGFTSYFGFCRKREGYSGVATYCKNSCSPIDAQEGLTSAYYVPDPGSTSLTDSRKLSDPSSLHDDVFTTEELKSLDGEGRVVITRHQLRILPTSGTDQSNDSSSATVENSDQYPEILLDNGNQPTSATKYLNIVNVYCPRLDPDRADRKEFKQNFYRLLQMRSRHLLKSGDHVLIVGDLNCSHKRIDHCDPEADPDFDQSDSRKWMDDFLYSGPFEDPDQVSSSQLIDLFRWLRPDVREAFTCWSNYKNARAINFGCRIDYAIADYGMIRSNLIADVSHLVDVLGSDHCPVQVTLKNCQFIKSDVLPRLCSKFMPEFTGEQQQMHQFLVKRTVVEAPNSDEAVNLAKKSKTAQTKAAASKNSTQSNRTLKDYFCSKTTSASRADELLIVSESVSTSASDSLSASQDSMSSSRSSENGVKSEMVAQWNTLFKQTKNEPPLCSGHGEPCVLRVSKKPGANRNRRFYSCGKPIGKKGDPNASCNYFRWAK